MILTALNFDSEITGTSLRYDDGSTIWSLVMHDPITASTIANKLGLTLHFVDAHIGEILLPKHIGNAAHAFDMGLLFQDFIDKEECV